VWNHAARVDGTVEDNTPNADAAVPDQFDLILQAEVGGILGNSGANYTLTFTARYRIAIPPGLAGAFHYNVRLVSENFQVISFAQSTPFLLV
jgi:hypothetical protein